VFVEEEEVRKSQLLENRSERKEAERSVEEVVVNGVEIGGGNRRRQSEETIGGGKVSTQHLESGLEKASFSIGHGKCPRPISGNISDQTVCESANATMKENQGPSCRDGAESTVAHTQ